MSLDQIFKGNGETNLESQKLLISARNGNSFVEKNKIVFNIDAKFVSLKNCYLHFDIAMNSGNTTNVKFNSSVQDIIKSIRITEKNTGRLIESIQSYNVLAANMYDYTNRSGSKNKKSLTELSRPEPNHNLYDILYSPFLQPYPSGSSLPVSDSKKEIKQKCVVQLYSGLFNQKDETAYPSVLAPLQIEVELENNKRALVLPNILQENGSPPNPEAITAADTTITLINNGAVNGTEYGIEGSPFNKGDIVTIKEGATTEDATITAVTVSANKYVYTCAALSNSYTTAATVFIKSSNVSTTYNVTNPAIEVAEVLVPDEWVNSIVDLVANDEFRYNIQAYENVPVNQTSGNTNFVNYINSNAQSVTGVLTIPTDSGTVDAYDNALIVGKYDNFSSFNYFYNGAPSPNLPVNCNKVKNSKVNQQHLSELQKYYDAIGHPVRDLQKFKDNFCVARAMSVYGGSLPLTSRDLSCRFDLVSGDSLATNMMFNNYLYKNLQLVVDRNGVRILG